MLVIRLSRTGKRHQAYFRIVVSDKRRTPTAKFVEILGNYDPHAKKLTIDKEKTQEYMKNGAVPSNSVAKLLAAEKIEMPKWVKITEKKRAPKAKEEKAEKKEAPKKDDAEKPAEGEEKAEEAPKEEVKEESETPKEGEDDKKDNNPPKEEAKPEGEAKEGE